MPGAARLRDPVRELARHARRIRIGVRARQLPGLRRWRTRRRRERGGGPGARRRGDPDQYPERYDRAAAIKFAADATSPLLILQGSDDDGVVPAQGESLHDAMKKAGKTVEYAIYWGEGHGFRHTGSRRDLYTR